jgi:hypothetical protein
MTNPLSIPPLRDLPPDQLQARKQHLVAEAHRDRRAPFSPPVLSLSRHRLLVLGSVGCATAAAAIFVTLGGSVRPHAVPPSASWPPGFAPIRLEFVRSGGSVASIRVVVNAPRRNGNMRLQVMRGNPYGPDSGRHVVFQEQAPMTNIKSPANGPPGTVALSTWSGTLSPSNWDGGCQNALYAVQAAVQAKGGGMTTLSEWFSCSSG